MPRAILGTWQPGYIVGLTGQSHWYHKRKMGRGNIIVTLAGKTLTHKCYRDFAHPNGMKGKEYTDCF